MAVTVEPGSGLAGEDACTLEMNMDHEVLPSIVCSLCLLLGIVYGLFGYRCFKVVMFFSGFMFGAAAVFLLYHQEPVLDAQLGPETKTGMGLGVGVLLGLTTLLVSTMGLVLCGLQLGCLLSLAALLVIGQFHHVSPVWVPVGVVAASGVVVTVLTLKWQKLFTVLYTSVFGATAVMLSVDYLLGTFVVPNQVYDLFCQVAPRRLCWFNWAVVGIAPAIALVSVLVQWKVTAKGVSHTEAGHKKHKKPAKKHRYTSARRRPQHHRRRRPPPLKRYAGDVLAPSYLQSLQERQTGTGSSTSSVSTITHTLIDFDFETGSMVPLTAAASSPAFAV